MNKSTRILLLVLLLLAGATTVLFYFGRSPSSTIKSWDREFAVPDAGSIQKIFLADRKGNQTNLERSGDGWTYNGKYPANLTVVNSLLEAITRVELQFIPPGSAVEPMVKDLATNGIKTEIYGKDGKLLKAYYVGGATPDETGTYMIMEGSEQPYVTELPYLYGSIRIRYALTGDQWRDKGIFRLDPNRIDYVSVEYPKLKNRSFILEKKDGDYAVRPFYETTPPITLPYKKGSAENYLTGFESIVAEAYENTNPLRDTIVQRLPFAIITVRTDDGAEKVARLHPAISSNRHMESGPPVYERYLVEVFPQNDFMLLQDRLVTQVLWGYDFFFIDENQKQQTGNQ
jgi:hypothetical protein